VFDDYDVSATPSLATILTRRPSRRCILPSTYNGAAVDASKLNVVSMAMKKPSIALIAGAGRRENCPIVHRVPRERCHGGEAAEEKIHASDVMIK
jgi:hypothetical protein